MKPIPLLLAALMLTGGLTGCATKAYVDEQVAAANKRIDGTEARFGALDARMGKNEATIAAASKTAQEALERAQAAGKAAEGKLLYEVVLSDDQFRFAFNDDRLGSRAMETLDALAARLKAANKPVYVEIQGHTDDRGSEAYNHMLGERRAKAVYRHLHEKGGLPLHHMSVISYGQARPVASNVSESGRAQNRRVVLVVLQ